MSLSTTQRSDDGGKRIFGGRLPPRLTHRAAVGHTEVIDVPGLERAWLGARYAIAPLWVHVLHIEIVGLNDVQISVLKF